MAQHAPAIFKRISDVWDCLRDRDFEEMLQAPPIDFVIRGVLLAAESSQNDSESSLFRSAVLQVLTVLVKDQGPRLFATCDDVKHWLERAKINHPELDQAIAERHADLFEQRSA
jgi:hypothetical protein